MFASLGALLAVAVNAAYTSFNCTDIIGVVFDDQNRNGVHDRFERGLPGVAIATLNGARVRTDRLGRFSLPCALTPGRFGSNYALKVDLRSLPSSFSITTQNPTVIRATAGHVHRVAFGVASW
jgi:hypothetical protein